MNAKQLSRRLLEDVDGEDIKDYIMSLAGQKQESVYAGFDAEYLNSSQPIPPRENRASVYHTLHQPWAMKYARAMRDKYGLNLWVDGTVTRGWHILVHKDRAEMPHVRV